MTSLNIYYLFVYKWATSHLRSYWISFDFSSFFKGHLGRVPSSGLVGAWFIRLLGCPSLLFLRAWCSPVCMYFPEYGARVPRGMVLNVVVTPGALREELGAGGGRGNGNPAERGFQAGPGWGCFCLPRLRRRTIPESRVLFPWKRVASFAPPWAPGVMLYLCILYKVICPFLL